MRNTPPIVRNLIIINVVMFILTMIAENFMYTNFSLFYIESSLFKPHQLLTHMFMHGGFMHLFFNMYTLWIFGSVLENVWGGKKFLFYFLVTGLGAAALHIFVQFIDVHSLKSAVQVGDIVAQAELMQIFRTPTVGASGAVYGLLLAFGMLFPNQELRLIFPPVALKAKWFVLIFGGIELFLGLSSGGGNIAHFAHLGGMIFGFFLIKYWQKKGRMYH